MSADTELKRFRELKEGDVFVWANQGSSQLTTYEARGNCWYQINGRTETGGPWHDDGERLVVVEIERPHPSQHLSCFV